MFVTKLVLNHGPGISQSIFLRILHEHSERRSNIVLCYLTLGTRQSSRTLFPLFAAKTSSRIFDGICMFSNKVAIPESKCLFGNRDGRLTRVWWPSIIIVKYVSF